jgi:hypothetical protein
MPSPFNIDGEEFSPSKSPLKKYSSRIPSNPGISERKMSLVS